MMNTETTALELQAMDAARSGASWAVNNARTATEAEQVAYEAFVRESVEYAALCARNERRRYGVKLQAWERLQSMARGDFMTIREWQESNRLNRAVA